MANGFDPGDHAAPYIQQTMTGGNTGGNRYHWSDSTTLGIGHGDGKSKCLHNIQGDIDVEALSTKAESWGRVYTHTKDVTTKLQAAYQRVFDNWSGDDADRARKTFGYTVDSAASVRDAAQGMHTGTTKLVTMANQVRGMGGGGPSTLGQVAHVESFGLIGAGGDGDQLQPAFDAYCNGLSDGCSYYPSTMEWQVKTAPSTPSVPAIHQGGDGAGGGGGVGGVNAPHLGGGAGHGSVPTSGISNPGTGGTPHQPNPHFPQEPGLPGQGGGTDPGGFGGGTPGTGGGATFGGGSGSGVPGLDSGSSLAGYDPTGGSGAFGGAGGGSVPFGGAGGGAGGLGSAGLGSAGLGGGLGGAGSLAGAGGGASGLGAAGGLAGAGAAEDAAAVQAAEAGAAGRSAGGQNLLPMRPGGQSGNDGERERSTWLTEDDDVWGESDAPPSVID